MALPKLPGMTFSSTLGQDKFHKAHHFDYANDIGLWVGDRKAGIGGNPLPGQRVKPERSVYPKGIGSNLPSWVAFDKQVLCFDAFFQEGVNEKREEQFRVRKVKIYFYLEDDSIQVVEPRTKNAQLAQGTIIRRHRIPKPPPCDKEHYTIDDFNIGREVVFYGQAYKLTEADDFTKNFLHKLGFKINQQEGIPADPYSDYRKAMDESMQPLRPYERFDTLKQFLDHDRHVLRFYGYWDDRDSMYGDERFLVVHYFLADDTIEIREVIGPNSGKDATPCLVRRGRIPKEVPGLPMPGQVARRTVLNTFGSVHKDGRYILDSLRTGAYDVDHYTDKDMYIGAYLNVYGRKVLLYDMDDFSKHFYRTKYGVEDFTSIEIKGAPAQPEPVEYPPYNNFGSEEDSLSSCQPTLQPKPPQRDFIKFMAKDRHGYQSNVLRFYAKLVTDKIIDTDRRFIISYFLSDDTILVFEPPQRNSGHLGGKFLERQRCKKPNQPKFSTRMSEYYQANDMFVGAVLCVNDFLFELVDADEYCIGYMEEHAGEFSQASVEAILAKLKDMNRDKSEEALYQEIVRLAPEGSQHMHYAQLRECLQQLAGGSLSEHEILTIARTFGQQTLMDTDLALYAYLVQDQLRKNNYDFIQNRLDMAFSQRDADKCGFLPVDEILKVIKSTHVPARLDQINILLKGLPSDEAGRLQYTKLLEFFNWKAYPIPPPGNYKTGEEDPTTHAAVDMIKKAQERVCYVDYQSMFNRIKTGCPAPDKGQ